MRTRLILICIILLAAKSYACICDSPKPALEFYYSEYVFEGKVIDKIYASDSLTYTVIFEINKHYKNGDKPKLLKFRIKSEGEITGRFTSCDWNVEKGETWLVYAQKIKNELNFSFYCSNSRPIDKIKIDFEEQKVLNHGNDLDLSKYRYTFYNAKPIINIDSILENYKNLKFDNPNSYAPLWIDVNKNGAIEKVNLAPRKKVKYDIIDTIFAINQFRNEYEEPRSDFQKTALEIARKINIWEKYYYLDLKKSFRYRTFLKFSVDKDSTIQLEK